VSNRTGGTKSAVPLNHALINHAYRAVIFEFETV